MADNKKPSEDPLVATDEVGGAHIQRVKPVHGADGSATDVSSASPMPTVDSAGNTLLTEIKSAVDGLEALLTTIDADTGNLSAILTQIGEDTDLLTAIKTAVETLDNAIAGSEMQVDVVAALPAGTNAIGKLAANSGVDIGDVDVTSIAAGTNAIGNVGLIPRTSGGLSIFRSLDIDETEEEVKGTAGQLYWYHFDNDATAKRYLKFYNATAASVTVGTTTPVLTLPLPKESSGHVAIPQGFAFSTAISVACTTGRADNDTGAPGANEVAVNLGYA